MTRPDARTDARPESAFEIIYVQFRDPVPTGGQHDQLEFWSLQKHGASISVVERGNWIVLTQSNGHVARVPMTNVAVIRENPRG